MNNNKFASGFGFYKIFWLFLFGCVFGAYYEEFLNLFIHFKYHHEWMWQLRRGVFYGPISPIYGFGAVLMVSLLKNKKCDYKILLYGAILGGSFEYMLSFLQEKLFGTVSWDYTTEFLNINGRTTIPFAIVWGLLALTLVKVVYPNISNIVESFPIKFGIVLTNILVVLVFVDFFISWGAIIRQNLRHNGFESITPVGYFFDEYYSDEVMDKYAVNTVIINAGK